MSEEREEIYIEGKIAEAPVSRKAHKQGGSKYMISLPPRWFEKIAFKVGMSLEEIAGALQLYLIETDFIVGLDKSRLLPFQIFVGIKVPERREKKD